MSKVYIQMTESSKEYKLNKGRRVINSCVTLEQLAVAWNYIDQMSKNDGGLGLDLWQDCWAKEDNIKTKMRAREEAKQAEHRSLLLKV